MSDSQRRKLQWRNKRANHGRKPNQGRRTGHTWKQRTKK